MLATLVPVFKHLKKPFKDFLTLKMRKEESTQQCCGNLMKVLEESTKALQDNNMLDNSIIVFTTDNGGGAGGQQGSPSTNWPLRGSKATTFEGGIRGSACVWSPLINDPGRVSKEMMHITDWFPTLYHAIGGSESVLPKMDGMNVWNSIQGNSPSPRNEFVININPILNEASIRVDDWKLLYNPSLNPGFETWFGPSERDFPTNKHRCSKRNDFKDVKNSLAGRTVQKLMPNIFKNIHKIRKNVEVLIP
ncbi:Arylsulfatase I [Armadillidium vulgare]|nr:Arylsulfatase I [Armadillidium vulgare]